MTVSIWWVILAWIIGPAAGIVFVALASGNKDPRDTRREE
jgi:hypothetical protein